MRLYGFLEGIEGWNVYKVGAIIENSVTLALLSIKAAGL